MAASNVFKVKMEKTDQLFNNYTTSVLWVQDGRSANEARTAELAIIVSYPISARLRVFFVANFLQHG